MNPVTATESASRNPFRKFATLFTASQAFPYLWLGNLISFLGSSVTMVILPVLVYSMTGSTKTMGFVMAIYMLPNVIMLPVSGHIVDRYDRVKIMISADIARFAIMVAIAVLSLTGALSIPLLYLFMGLYGMLDGLFRPAYSATQAMVFTPDIRIAANSLTQMSTQAVRLIGPALGGLLITHLSAGIGFGLDAFTYILSLFCLIYLRRALTAGLRGRSSTDSAGVQEVSAAGAPHTSPNWKDDFKEGIAVLRSHPWLWITIITFSFFNICFAGVTSILIPWLFKVYHGWPPYIYGLAVTCSGAGAIVAGLVYSLRQHWTRRGIMAYGGVILSCLALFLMPFIPNAAVAVALFTVEGFGLMIFGLIWEISLQELVPQEAFGRVASLDLLGSFALLPVGYILVGWLADQIGGLPTITIFSGLGILCAASVLCLPAIRRFQ
ncbi:MFS transporter [Paenibacillus typhae]|uniref:Sugar phosphate permease n=1 Tax=Paenibacillus typhae TaxID=1174501 RepID=A0A1G9FIK5_9BACL|nr:MFS transporter [Paenibacillus typhae]SDK88230.1 Sugar phosphate permease [Paenibacillus typhae]